MTYEAKVRKCGRVVRPQLLSGFLAFLMCAGPTAVLAQAHSGKPINVYIGYDPGGGYDFYGRLFARHIGKQLPGNPQVTALNMPGAAGLSAANYLYEIAPKDGTALGIVAQTLALAEALKTPGVRFKAANFNWIGRVTSNVEVTLMWHTSKVQSIDDAKAVQVPVSGTSPGSAAYDYPAVLNGLVGTKFKIIGGYQSAAPMMLAMERGETDGSFTSWNTIKTSKQMWLKENKIKIIVQYTADRHPDLPGVPTMVELGRNDREKQILRLFASGAIVGRSILAPPGVPAANVKQLREAFTRMLKDEAFLAEIQKTGAEFDPLSGELLQNLMETIVNVPDDVMEAAQIARGVK
jgi:tripartite-type tricarboxylate transporter receptor subunit TctC